MTFTKTTITTSALEKLSANMDSDKSKKTCSPTEIHALQMLLCGAISGKLKEWPVLRRVLKKKGFKFDPNTWCTQIRKELRKDCYKIDPYCEDYYVSTK